MNSLKELIYHQNIWICFFLHMLLTDYYLPVQVYWFFYDNLKNPNGPKYEDGLDD